MTTPAFTAGPWHIGKKYKNDVYSTNRRQLVARAKMTGWISDVEASANAQLITASPELYEALQAVAQALDWQAHGCCRGFSETLLSSSDALDKARAALKKATGETK